MAKVFNKKNIKILSIIYFIIILIVSIITFIILLGRIINKEEDYLKYKNNIIISSLSNDLKLKINENDNYLESIEIKTDKDILNKKVKGINDYKEFYYFDHEYKLINNNDNDYIISFNLYLLTSKECNISFNKESFYKEFIDKEEVKRNSDIRIGFYEINKIYQLKTNENNYEIKIDSMDSLDLDFLNFEIINNTKICVLKTELGNVIKLRLNKDEEVIKINLIENDRLDLIGLFIPNLNNINFGDENYKSLNKDLIIRGNKIIINNIINKKIHVKIWNEGNINNTNDIKSLINLVIDVNYYLDPLDEEIEKLNKVYYNEGYLCIDGKIINTNLFKMLYSYDGIDYSYYNKAYLSDECDNVYIKTMNNDIYKSSEARIVIYGEKND